MFRLTVYAILLVVLSPHVRSHLVELDEYSGVVSIQRGVGTGKSTVWQSFDDSHHHSSNRKSRHVSNGNHFQHGWKSPGNVLLHREVVQTLKDYTIFFHRAAGVITYLEAHDQSNGTGGFVSYIDGGVHQTSVEVEFRQVEDAVSNIEFIVEIWGFPYSNEGVHAADFRIGELTERSAWDTSLTLIDEAQEHETISMIWAMVGLPEKTFTFVEAFDMSPNGDGGIVQLIGGGIGQSTFYLGVRSVAPGVAVNVSICAYSVDELNGGQNFRLGTWKPEMKLFADGYLQQEARPKEVVTDIFNYADSSTTIEFVQGWDRISGGTGGLVALAGGVGYSNVSLNVNSGVGEDLGMLINVFGWEH